MVSLTDREEDYLRTIYEIENQKGYVKVKDIAKRLNITPSSVVGMMKKLSKKELIHYRKYESIRLTNEGEIYAKAVSKRHQTFRELLDIMGVPEYVAQKDAHILEHHLHVKTINQFNKLVQVIKTTDLQKNEIFTNK